MGSKCIRVEFCQIKNSEMLDISEKLDITAELSLISTKGFLGE